MGTSSRGLPVLVATALVGALAVLGTLVVVPAAAGAPLDAAVNEVTLAAPASATKRAPATFTITTSQRVGDVTTPVAGASVTLQVRTGTGWTAVAEAVSDQSGQAEVTTTLDDRDVQTFRASTTPPEPGSEPVTSAPIDLEVANQAGPLVADLADAVNDGGTLPLSISWKTSTGLPIPGRVQVHRFEQGRWATVAVLDLDSAGTATITVTPRWDSTWYVTGDQGSWYDAARSADQLVDNIPPGVAVAYPAEAPLPTVVVPPQPRATAPGAAPVITRVPTRIWRSMVGVSWHRGCPVGRTGLRLLRINYWGFDGYRYRGELVASTRVIRKFRAALVELYTLRYPIRSMYLPEYFGYSPTLRGADDLKMMAAGNTSAFNCRRVVNARRISPHATGRSIDVNPWENPYFSAKGVVPNTWWAAWSWAPITARTRTDLLVRVFARHQVRWTYGLQDSQHFDG